MRVVFSGGPNTGKSTLIRMLADLGFIVVEEQATAVIQDGGPNPCTDHEAFQLEVLARQLRTEAALAGVPLLFMDRGTFDGVPYREIYGRRVLAAFAKLQPRSYDVCFIPDQLPWVNDGVRYETPEFTSDVQPLFTRVYGKADIPVVRIPVMSPEDRVLFVLDHVGRAMKRNLAAVAMTPHSGIATISANPDRKERRWFSIPSLPGSMSSAGSLLLAKAG